MARVRKEKPVEERKMRERLLQVANERNDLRLYKLANGEGEIIDYLIKFVNDNNLGGLAICGETLESVLRANAARRKKVYKWFNLDKDPVYKEIHAKELVLLDEYAESMLIEIFNQIDDLKIKAAEDVAAAKKAAAEKAAKRATKTS